MLITNEGDMRGILQRLHRDERGDAVQFILIAAAVAIPLIIVLVVFGDDITGYLSGRGGELNGTEPGKYDDQFD